MNALRQLWVWITLGVWCVACVASFCGLWVYANTPGDMGSLRADWAPPPEMRVPDDLPMLVLFAHPKCPCTRSTMSELERLQGDLPGAFATRVIFYEPDGADVSWRGTDLWRRARRLPDSEVIPDPGGEITMAAGANISGCIALFDADGSLKYWGGITPARGHEGESTGSVALRAVLREQRPGQRRAPVYGCEILGPVNEQDDCSNEGVCGVSSDD